jgi:phage tail-like protein
MSRPNIETLSELIPSRYWRADEEYSGFLKRFLYWFALECDRVDSLVDNFFKNLDPATAPEEFLNWWLYSMFGWGWFPVWFTLDQKRAFYQDIARHLARRGTRRGIEEFLAAFGLTARVTMSPTFYGEEFYGEETWLIPGPLVIVITIYPVTGAQAEDLSFYGEASFGEDYSVSPALTPGQLDIDGLIRFFWPLGNVIIVEDLTAGA